MGLHVLESVGCSTYNRARAAEIPYVARSQVEANLFTGQGAGPGASVSASFDNIQHRITSYSPIVHGLTRSSRDAKMKMKPRLPG